MIKGIGIDAVEIERFAQFYTYSRARLSRIFSTEEIDYCLSAPVKSAERFAARFAAKEALYKALTQACGVSPGPFLKLCKYARIIRTPAPYFIIAWYELGIEPLAVLVAITHTNTTAYAQVMIQ